MRRRSLLVALALPAVALAAGCFTPDDRPAQLAAIARWQDVRLAPADSLRTFLTGPDAHVRLAAVRAAGLIGRDDVLPEVMGATADPSLTVAAEAAWALGLMGDAEALPLLATLAADPRPPLREAAVMGLTHLDNDGTALLRAAAHEDPVTAALAWNGLRNQAARVDTTALREAIVAGLARPETDIRWRVLRCAEMRADTTLVPVLAPFTRSPHDQVVVHAYRALARQDAAAALPAVLAGLAHLDDFHGRRAARVRIAACRALGTVGRAALDDTDDLRPDRVAATLISAAGHADPHVAETALRAMTDLVADRPLPAEAADQESLLPVWRIRLARAARGHLASPHVGVRAAAVTALGATRGAGAAAELQRVLLMGETSPHVLAAALGAVAAHHPAPVPLLVAHLGDELPRTDPARGPRRLNGMVRAAALD
ncbi:HEAT repeat domain-containing protein, partial [bacterium]|nr:HEAT repeat domain-containing protein [bacterium]